MAVRREDEENDNARRDKQSGSRREADQNDHASIDDEMAKVDLLNGILNKGKPWVVLLCTRKNQHK